MRIGLIQLAVSSDLLVNLKRAREGVEAAVAQGAHLVVLPEMFCCPYNSESFVANAESEGGPVWQALSEMARASEVYLVGGSVPERDAYTLERYNTSFVFSPEGTCIAKHRKVHLFDVDLPGGISFRESDTLTAGDRVTVFDTPWCRIGVAICYDLRFPELFRRMALMGAQMAVVPGAFNMTSGPAHWELLARGRAVDNQLQMALCSPARDMAAGYVAYGHSLIADCWGAVKAQLNEAPGLLVYDIDLEQVSQVRQQLPLLQHLRPDVYGER